MLSLYILIEVFALILLLVMGLVTGFILPADYSQNYLMENKDIIAQSQPFDHTLIPHTCNYGLFDFDGNYISGNFKKTVVDDAKAFLKDSNSSKHRFFLIENAKGYCVVKYDVTAHFASHTLDRIFLKPELLMLILFIIIFIIIVIQTSNSFGRRLKKELQPVLYEIGQIQNREINTENKINSKVKEFNDILQSLYDMKIALTQSLKKEWETEQKRKSNISALAHDIKTPLTIIKGNSELILEEENLSEIYKLADVINSNSDKIERYIKLLIDETKSNSTVNGEEKVSVASIVTDIISESEALCKAKGIELIIANTVLDTEVIVNKGLIERAVINLVKNAIEHTLVDKRIKVSFEGVEKSFIVTVEDFGKGFTKEALRYAKNQFYSENAERSDEHYGIGMYFANNVAEKYKGRINYYNKPNQTGAVVTFEITFG